MLPENCLLFSKAKLIYFDGNREKLINTDIGLLESGILIKFQSLNENEAQQISRPSLKAVSYLDINFSYMDFEKSNQTLNNDINYIKTIKASKVGTITLKRNNKYYQITDIETQDIKEWVKLLNQYVVRIDRPKNYKILNKLGEGANASVYKVEKIRECKSLDGLRQSIQFALKVFNKAHFTNKVESIQLLKDEIFVHRQLRQCQSALQLFKVYESPSKLYLLLELQEGGTLFDLIKNKMSLTEKDLQTIFGQLLLGLDFMHQQNIIHRDLKLDNILLSSNKSGIYEIRLADFGLAKQILPFEVCYHKCGTPTYIAPEILRGDGYNTKADLFSMGSLMYNLVTGQYLFPQSHPQMLLALNKECNLFHVRKEIQGLSIEGQDLMMRLLDPDPKRRFDCQQALKHRWFQQDQEALLQGLLINSELMNINLEKKSIIYTAMIKDPDASCNFYSQNISCDSKNPNRSRMLRIQKSTALSISSFFQGKISQSSLCRNDSKDSKDSVNYYEIIEAHRQQRTSSQNPIFKRRESQFKNSGSNLVQQVKALNNEKNHKKRTLKRNQSQLVEKRGQVEESKLIVLKNHRKSKFVKVSAKDMKFQCPQNEENIIHLNISEPSNSLNSIGNKNNKAEDIKQEFGISENNNSNDSWNISDYQGDEMVENDESCQRMSNHQLNNNSNNHQLTKNLNYPMLGRVFLDQ
eukprot:403366224